MLCRNFCDHFSDANCQIGTEMVNWFNWFIELKFQLLLKHPA